MPHSKEPPVEIVYDPPIPKDRAGTLVEVILASEEAARWARRFLISNNPNDARSFMNARLRLKNMACKQQLPQSEAAICSGGYPFGDEERKRALILLKEADAQARL